MKFADWIKGLWPWMSKHAHAREIEALAAAHRREARAAEARHRADLGLMRCSGDWA